MLSCVGALPFDVRNCGEMRKSGKDIANLLHKVGQQIMSETDRPLSDFGGWTVDNTKANYAAITELADMVPEWVNIGCAAHGMNLAMKELCKVTKTRGRYASTFGVSWMADVTEHANTVANYLQDSSLARALHQRYQKDVLNGIKRIAVSVPTRFASNYFVMLSLFDSKPSLVQSVNSSEWNSLSGKSQEVYGIVTDEDGFWVPLKKTIDILKPFSDFLHQIEADSPALGKCYSAILQLDKHIESAASHLAPEDAKML